MDFGLCSIGFVDYYEEFVLRRYGKVYRLISVPAHYSCHIAEQ